jgi:predicted transport protein
VQNAAIEGHWVMGDVKLFRMAERGAVELNGTTDVIEKSLQTTFERNLDTLLGTRFLASEFRTTNGRIDTLGIDENDCPVIVEYKRSINDHVVTQGLFYLDWLLDHRKDFEWLVLDKIGKDTAKQVDWSEPRLVCIAGDFNRYDEHAVKQVQRNIELIRYRRFGQDLLLLDLVTVRSDEKQPGSDAKEVAQSAAVYKSVTEYLASADDDLRNLFNLLRNFLVGLGDDVQERTLKNYFAFTRIKNFACVEIKPTARKLLVYVKVDPDTITLEAGFTRDVRQTGHYGTGDLEITIDSRDDVAQASPLLKQSYDES